MSEWRLIKLNFGRSPAHFGELGIGIEETSERVRSDSLFSAWVTAYARLFGSDAVEDFLNQFLSQAEPPFRISSTFVYHIQNGQEAFYLPRPRAFPNQYPVGDDMSFAKDYKNLNYLPLGIWKRWYQTREGFSPEDLNASHIKAYGDTYRINKVPKVAIDRTTRATNFYHTGFVQFKWEENDQSGLYFLLTMPEQDQDLEEKLKATLEFLGEEGIGGERSSGAGRFRAIWQDLPSEWRSLVEADGNQHTLISTFWDSPVDDSLLEESSYELQERGGWITSPFSGQQRRRKSIQMFAEGSVFSQRPKGKLANVTPTGFNTHPIYRSGIALSLPICLNYRQEVRNG